MKAQIDQLELYLLELEEKYIAPHLDPLQSPEDYQLDVKSFCVLSHAAFEEFLESLTLNVLNEVEKNFTNNLRISYSTLCLLHFKGTDKDVDDDNWKDDDKLYDRLRKQLCEIKSSFSNFIMENNHGIKLKYLKRLLVPLGLDLPTDMKEITSLDNLAKYRGAYAHTSHRKSLLVSPEDAWECVSDVNDMCIKLAKKALGISYYSIH